MFFFAILVLLLTIIRPQFRKKKLLLLASYVFYMWWNPAFILLIVYSTAVDFVVGGKLGSSINEKKRKQWLWVSVVANLFPLILFKYGTFFQESLLLAQQLMGYEPSWSTLNLILPVGISFYTLQSLSYTIDVYRQRIKPTSNPVDFALYVSFFPQLVAGPIIRARDFLPQLRRKISFCFDNRAFFLVLSGLVKKVVIADNLAPFVFRVYKFPELYNDTIIWLAVIAFAIQLYCDFSGYSEMAIGIARMLGFKFKDNFNHPYFATDPISYWRRWHISLSEWFRDYVYVSLGGNQGSKTRESLNVFFVVSLSGLWHGGNWNYLFWGVFHGIVLVVHRLCRWNLKPGLLEAMSKNKLFSLVSWMLMNYLVLFSYVIFRAHNWDKFKAMMMAFLIPDFGMPKAQQGLGAMLPWVLLVITFFSVLHLVSWRLKGLHTRLAISPLSVRIGAAFLIGLLLFFGWSSERTPFIYFQF